MLKLPENPPDFPGESSSVNMFLVRRVTVGHLYAESMGIMSTASPRTIFITGATGLVGGHAVEEALTRGHRVRALVRPTSDTRWLERWDVERIVGDLEDPAAIRAGVKGADWVFNCAAKVGDWGPLEEFRRLNVEAL